MFWAVLSGFIGSAIAPWIHKRNPKAAGWILSVLPVGLTLYFAQYVPVVARGEVIEETVLWVPALQIRMSFYLDGLSLMFSLLISGIGALIVIYTGGYLHGVREQGRFHSFMLMFMASMLGVVLSDNVITLFIFWELTSFSSYLLIGFDSRRERARAAALQALLVTGLGGLFLLAGLILLGEAGGSYSLSVLLRDGFRMTGDALFLPVLLLLLAGAFTKSAQVPFHFWLPRAMEAPTPASAYLHSTTMVKAGVYLIARMSPIMNDGFYWTAIIAPVGAATLIVAACMALKQTHFKPLLAYSTVSALGAMTMLLGAGTSMSIQAAVVFLVAHAFYKASLFLVAGAVDHATGEKNVEKLGGLRRSMPVLTVAAGVAALSMAGLPPLLGFVAKETFYEATLALTNGAGWLTAAGVVSSMLFFVIAFLTGIRPFWGPLRQTPRHPHDPPASMWLGPVVLAIGAVSFGFLPGHLAEYVAAPAASAIQGEPLAVKLYLWHGFNAALLLSIATVAGGIAMIIARPTILRLTSWLQRPAAWGPERWYDMALTWLNAIAGAQTRVLQNGHLRYYLLIIVFTTILGAGYTLWNHAPVFHIPDNWLDARYYEIGLVIVILMAIVAAVVSFSRLAAVAALGVVGYGVALLYVLFGAPDLAMTQFVIETLTLVLLVLAFYHLPPFKNLTAPREHLRDIVVAGTAGLLMTVLVLFTLMPPFHPSISGYFAEHSAELAHGRNIVNVILVDFRALDTLGEITVLALAGVGGYALLKLRVRKEDKR